MGRQVIISIGREYGSGGRYIAGKLAERFGLPLYDRNILDEIAEEIGADSKHLSKYDEAPKHYFLSRRVRGYSNSPEENVAHMQFDFLKKKAGLGESFVVLGRCSEHILRANSNMVSVFILADEDAKVKRIMEVRGFTEREAKAAMARHDRGRKIYHNHYSNIKWGDSRGYDLCVNSGKLGLDRTVDMLELYIKDRMAEK